MIEDHELNKTARWTFYTAAVIFAILGVLSTLHPYWLVVSAPVFLGIGFLISGINCLVPYFSMKEHPERLNWLLPFGIVDITFGLFFISRIALSIFRPSTLVVAWILLQGLVRIYSLWRLKAAGLEKWWVMLVTSVSMIAASLLLFFKPADFGLWVGMPMLAVAGAVYAEGRIMYEGIVGAKRASKDGARSNKKNKK